MNGLVDIEWREGWVEVVLNDPQRRNALGLTMFDALDAALANAANDQNASTILLRGEGPAFCAGFDMVAAAADSELVSQFIVRLSAVNRTIRRSPQVVVAAVQGAAIAGGCAVVSACDFVVVSPEATLGYPVHRLGVSPAVTIPTLSKAIGFGAARELLMSGQLIDGREAHRRGLATHLAKSNESVLEEARVFCEILRGKGRHALRVTKQWINELDGSLEDQAFDGCARASAMLASEDEAKQMLRHWMKNAAERSGSQR